MTETNLPVSARRELESTGAVAAKIHGRLTHVLSTLEIPARPEIVEAILVELHADEPDFHRLEHQILMDVGLASGLVKTANSAAFGFKRKSANVQEALMVLGLLMVSYTVAGLALRNVLPEGRGLVGFWETSARIALLGAWLVGRLGVRDGVRAPDAHTYGLFRDCGIPVLLKANPGYEQTLAAASRERLRSFTDVEAAASHAADHAEVGAAMAHRWGLPEAQVVAICFHHSAGLLLDDEALAPPSRRLIAIGALAEHLQQLPGAPANHEWEKIGEAALAVLGISHDDVAKMRSDALHILEE